MKIIKNTYPEYPSVAHGKIGDIVHWDHNRCFNLIRNIDNRVLFMTPPVTSEGKLRSNNKEPILIGIVAQNKSKNYILEIK